MLPLRRVCTAGVGSYKLQIFSYCYLGRFNLGSGIMGRQCGLMRDEDGG